LASQALTVAHANGGGRAGRAGPWPGGGFRVAARLQLNGATPQPRANLLTNRGREVMGGGGRANERRAMAAVRPQPACIGAYA
jgi:hypothetical protein